MGSRPSNGLSLCAGAGGLDMGLMLAEPGFHTRCFVEWEECPRQAIIAAQRAGYFAPAPIWDDVTTFDGKPMRGAIDTILAGYPCQPFSQAGQRKGADDERHLWPDVARIIREIGPEWVFLENVLGHVSLGLEAVLRELWDMGFTPAVGIFSAEEIGATHERQRVFIVAHADRENRNADGGTPDSGTDGRDEPIRGSGSELANASGRRLCGSLFPPGPNDAGSWADAIAASPYLAPATGLADCLAWASDMAQAMEIKGQAQAESDLRRMANGLALRSRALRLLGNGVCPLAAAYAWRTLASTHGIRPLDLEADESRGAGA